MGLTAGNKRAVRLSVAVICSVLWVVLLLLPFGVHAEKTAAEIVCYFEDGSSEALSYAEAYPMLRGVSDSGELLLERGTLAGTAETGEAFRRARDTLDTGGLEALLCVRTSDMVALERLALWREYGKKCYYAGEPFAYTGERVERVNSFYGTDMVLLSGGVTADTVARAGVLRLELRKDAQFTARTLVGTQAEVVAAQAPYEVRGGAVYADTVGGKRLIAGMPSAERLSVSGYDYADRGALLPCTRLRELTLDFIGSARSAAGSDYSAELAHLFRSGSEYLVPATLKKLTVLGGSVSDLSLYACGGLEEISLCGVPPENISEDALYGLKEWRLVHAPRALRLVGEYEINIRSCGCKEYRRTL